MGQSYRRRGGNVILELFFGTVPPAQGARGGGAPFGTEGPEELLFHFPKGQGC